MNEQHLKNVVEAALLAAARPLQPDELRDLFDEFERPEIDEVKAALAALTADYEGRGVEVREVASGFRIQVREAVATPVSRLWQERPPKYSRAFLETLALIAYRQPITRGEIEEIRGVAVNPNIVRTLMERGWVRVVGHREVPGRPELLGTTREFLDYFGLRSLDDLPTLAQLRDLETLGVQLEFGAAAPEAADAQRAPAAALDSVASAGADVAEAADASTAHAELAAESGADQAEIPADATAGADETVAAAAEPEPAFEEAPDLDDDTDTDDAGERQPGARAAGLVAFGEPSAGRRDPRD